MEKDGEKLDIPADSVVLALGVRPNAGTVQEFKDAFENVYVVGDARQGGRIATAIREGYEAGYTFEG